MSMGKSEHVIRDVKEEWRSVPSLQGICEVSSLGHVRTSRRQICIKGRKAYWIEGKTKGIWLNSVTGYLCVTINEKNYSVHRLVAESFIPNPTNLPEVNHKNEIKTDNRVENLEWCTRKYNINYGTHKERCALAHVGPIDVYSLDLELVNSFPSITAASKFYRCSISIIADCVQHKVSQCIGLIFVKKGDHPKGSISDFRVRQIDAITRKVIGVYSSPMEAKRRLGLNNNNGIVSCCRGKIKTSNGFIWEYVNEAAYRGGIKNLKKEWKKNRKKGRYERI